MPGFSTSTSHALGQAVALARLQPFVQDALARYAEHLEQPQGEWQGNQLAFSFRALGMPVSGTLWVEDAAVHVQGQLPLAAVFFRGRIEEAIRTELERLLR